MHRDPSPGRTRPAARSRGLSPHALLGLTPRPRRLVLRVLLGLALGLFVLGSFASGWFFLSRAVVPAQAPAREELVGADTNWVAGAPSRGTSAALPTKAPSDPRYAFLLLGCGGEGYDGAYLTDSIIDNPSEGSDFARSRRQRLIMVY